MRPMDALNIMVVDDSSLSTKRLTQILGLLGRQRTTLRVGEVCRSLDIPKSSASRLSNRSCRLLIVEATEHSGRYGHCDDDQGELLP